jgi:hypothetical protein
VRRHRLREPFVYFVDECLGRHVVPDALRQAVDEGERVEVLPQGTADVDWIPLAHAGGWVCLSPATIRDGGAPSTSSSSSDFGCRSRSSCRLLEVAPVNGKTTRDRDGVRAGSTPIRSVVLLSPRNLGGAPTGSLNGYVHPRARGGATSWGVIALPP